MTKAEQLLVFLRIGTHTPAGSDLPEVDFTYPPQIKKRSSSWWVEEVERAEPVLLSF